jgi:hypothetical protein
MTSIEPSLAFLTGRMPALICNQLMPYALKCPWQSSSGAYHFLAHSPFHTFAEPDSRFIVLDVLLEGKILGNLGIGGQTLRGFRYAQSRLERPAAGYRC